MTAPTILAAVSEAWGVPADDVAGRRKHAHVSQARHAWYYLMRRAGHSLHGTKKLVDRGCHTTILHGSQRIDRELKNNKPDVRRRVMLAAELAGIDLDPKPPLPCCPTCGRPSEETTR